MNKSESIAGLAKALSLFQGEIKNAYKGSQGHGYKYADLAFILDSARELLSKHGLSVVQMPSGEVSSSVNVDTCVMHESGEWMEQTYSMPIPDNKRNSAAQNLGSAITYARRYALAAALGIAQTDDDAAQPDQLTDTDKQWIDAVKANPAVIEQITDLAYRNKIMTEVNK